jgi:predicted nucleotidyltransferase
MSHHINTVRIKAIASALDSLNEKVVFVGGATLSLYADQPIGEVRPTDDVDVIIEILNYSDRAKLEDKLRAIGFSHDIAAGVLCRYRIQGMVVDIMPTNDPSIGFTNNWYPDGFKNAVDYRIDDQSIVKILSAPYFIATKLEAHKNRGQGDGRTSHDFEDIICVLENRENIWAEMNNVGEELKLYLQTEFRNLLKNPNIFEWIDCHVERTSPPATYSIMKSLEKFTA